MEPASSPVPAQDKSVAAEAPPRQAETVAASPGPAVAAAESPGPAAVESSVQGGAESPGPAGGESSGPAAGVAAAASPRLAAKEGRRPRDMFISLAVLLVPIALVMGFYRVVLEGDRPVSVDPASSVELASREFPVAQPAGLDEDDDWHVTSANFRREDGGATLRLGYVAPNDNAFLLVQSNVDASVLVPAEVGNEGQRTGTFRTAQRAWLQYSGRPGETALIATEQTRTILIIGDSGDTENLQKLASSLP